MSLSVAPITLRQARAYVEENHRHHRAPQGGLFAIAVMDDEEKLRGVSIVGRPVARGLDDGRTAEVTRLCTDGAHNACSMLYAASWRAARAMGYWRLITYTLAAESGVSLSASGWRVVGEVRGKSWNNPSRKRTDKHPTTDKRRWEISLGETA